MLKIIIILLKIIEKSDFAYLIWTMKSYFSEGQPIGRVIQSNKHTSAHKHYLCLLYFNDHPSPLWRNVSSMYCTMSSIQLCVFALMNYCLRLQPTIVAYKQPVRCNYENFILSNNTAEKEEINSASSVDGQQMSMEINLHLSWRILLDIGPRWQTNTQFNLMDMLG